MESTISQREYQVLVLVSHAFSTKEIASKLYVSFDTAKTHRKNLLQKLDAKNVAQLIRRAFELKILKVN